MGTRKFRVYRDAYVITEVDVDDSGRVIGKPEVYVQSYDSVDIVEETLDGRELENASFPGGTSWPEGMPEAMGAGAQLAVNSES